MKGCIGITFKKKESHPDWLFMCTEIPGKKSLIFFFFFFFFVLQSNSLLVPDSLRSTDKRRNGPEFANDIKKRKVDDKDSSHYVSKQKRGNICLLLYSPSK